MSDVIVDLSNYRDSTGARVDPGRYRVQVEDAELTKANSGNQMINLWLRIVGGDFNGSTLVDRLVLTEKSLFRVVGFMQAIGLPTPKKRIKVNLRKFIGRTLDVDVDDGDPYRGVVRTEVRNYIRVAKAASESSEDIDDLDEDQDAEDVSDEPTDYDEDEEPEKVIKAKAKRASKAKAKKAESPEDADEDDDDVDLDNIDI